MSVSLTVMTFNLHEDQPEDSPYSWEKRRDLCISVITSYSPMILCTQQGLQIRFFLVDLVCPCAFAENGRSGSVLLCFGDGFSFIDVLLDGFSSVQGYS